MSSLYPIEWKSPLCLVQLDPEFKRSHQGSCTLYLSALLAFSLLHPQILFLPMEAMWPLEVPEKEVDVFAETFGEKSYGRF